MIEFQKFGSIINIVPTVIMVTIAPNKNSNTDVKNEAIPLKVSTKKIIAKFENIIPSRVPKVLSVKLMGG